LFASAGQSGALPVQVSVRSQTPAAGRHTVSAATKLSGGQSFVTPSQFSATSQAPAAGRQTAVLFASAGQSGLTASQNSATSQAPAAARQSAPGLPAGCWQLSLSPSQTSTVQTLPSSAQGLPASCFASPGQAASV